MLTLTVPYKHILFELKLKYVTYYTDIRIIKLWRRKFTLSQEQCFLVVWLKLKFYVWKKRIVVTICQNWYKIYEFFCKHKNIEKIVMFAFSICIFKINTCNDLNSLWEFKKGIHQNMFFYIHVLEIRIKKDIPTISGMNFNF